MVTYIMRRSPKAGSDKEEGMLLGDLFIKRLLPPNIILSYEKMFCKNAEEIEIHEKKQKALAKGKKHVNLTI